MHDTITSVLAPTLDQQRVLDETFQMFERACHHAMEIGRAAGTTGNAVIHRLCYQQLRKRYGLSANLTVRAIASAARSLKATDARDRSDMVIEYDRRIFSIDLDRGLVSLSTVAGRLRDLDLPLTPSARNRLRAGRPVRAVLSRTQGESYRLTITVGQANAECE